VKSVKSWHILLAELVALGIIIYQARSEPTATVSLKLPSGAQKLLDPGVVNRTTTRGPNPTGTVGGVTYREGGGLY